MKNTRKKVTHMVDELITYFYSVGSNDMVIKIKETPEGFKIFFASNFDIDLTYRVEKLQHFLMQGRAPEIEESYWGLTGMGNMHDENEIILVGAMLDRAQVDICDGYATLNLFRKYDTHPNSKK